MTTHTEALELAMVAANLDPRNPEAKKCAEALVAAYIEATTPKGWKLVPIDPTIAMMNAVTIEMRGKAPWIEPGGTISWGRADQNLIYRAMIEAAPPFAAPTSPPAAIIAKIAQVATVVAFQAGEPAMEIAGMIVSSLAANPENIERFMAAGTELLLEGKIGFENGALSYRANNGEILSPTVLREKKGTQQ